MTVNAKNALVDLDNSAGLHVSRSIVSLLN